MACFLQYFCFSNVLKSAITTWLEVRSIDAHKVILWKINLIKIRYNIKLLLYDQGRDILDYCVFSPDYSSYASLPSHCFMLLYLLIVDIREGFK